MHPSKHMCTHQSHHMRTSTPFPVGVHDQSNLALTTQRVTQHCKMAPPLQFQKIIAKRTEQRLKRNQLLNTSMTYFDKLVQNFFWNHTASLELWISKVANDYSLTYLEPTTISLSISRQLQVFLSSFRYSQPTAVIVIYAHQLSWSQIFNLTGFWF